MKIHRRFFYYVASTSSATDVWTATKFNPTIHKKTVSMQHQDGV
ncbi:MAG TPA: hypothetical protein VL022_09105 [Moheibacter sp.]|nr:hypothetical protein [Moheibacter sp.]